MRVSLSGSLKLLLTSTVAALPPTVIVCAEIVPTAVGARFGCGFTVTAMVCVAVRLPSLAVTVIVAEPAATGVMLTLDPETLAVAFAPSEELAV